MQPPPKRSRFLLWFVLIMVLCLCLAAASPDFRQGFSQGLKPMIDAWNNVHQSAASTATADSTPVPEWVITSTFGGNGTSHTATFAVHSDWQLNWYCQIQSGMSQTTISIDVDRPGQRTSLVPFAVDANCSTNVYSGSTEEFQTGTLYLAVTSNTQWTIDIEQLQ